MLRVLGALPTVSLLAGLTAVANRGLALGGGVAGVPGVAGVVSVDVLQCEGVFHIQRWHVCCQPREGELTVELWSSSSLLAGQEYWLVPGQRPEGKKYQHAGMANRQFLPLKDKISLLQNNIESNLQQAVVQSVAHVVLLQDVSLGTGPGSSILG